MHTLTKNDLQKLTPQQLDSLYLHVKKVKAWHATEEALISWLDGVIIDINEPILEITYDLKGSYTGNSFTLKSCLI